MSLIRYQQTFLKMYVMRDFTSSYYACAGEVHKMTYYGLTTPKACWCTQDRIRWDALSPKGVLPFPMMFRKSEEDVYKAQIHEVYTITPSYPRGSTGVTPQLSSPLFAPLRSIVTSDLVHPKI